MCKDPIVVVTQLSDLMALRNVAGNQREVVVEDGGGVPCVSLIVSKRDGFAVN